MIRSRIFLVVVYSICLIFFVNCNSSKSNGHNERNYIHIDGNDTSRLRLVIYDNRFFGTYKHTKGGVAPIVGEINGDIKDDLLIGDNLYTPYRWKEKKRLPIALRKVGENYLEGDGQMVEMMGVVSYKEHTLHFDPPKRVYKPVE